MSEFITGPWLISHDDGETWHREGLDCSICRSDAAWAAEGRTAITVTAVNRLAGTITVTVTGAKP